MTTIVDVSRESRVSTATVSRVLNHPEQVDITTRKHVEAVIARLNYRPNQIASGLARQSSRTIGVVVNLFESRYYGAMIDGAVSALKPLGYHVIAEAGRESVAGEIEAVSSLLSRQCEGIVLHADALSDKALAGLLRKHPTMVSMNRKLPNLEEQCVYLDNAEGGRLAAHFLFDCGHTQLAMVTGPEGYHQAQARKAGFLSAASERKVEINSEHLVCSNYTASGGAEAMKKLLATRKRPSAVFFQSDEMAAGALMLCRELGISVPEEISLIGFDDLELAEFMSPTLTTVRQPLVDIGKSSALLALSLSGKLPKHEIPVQRTFAPELIKRNSVLDRNC